jgi:hypothetical protein
MSQSFFSFFFFSSFSPSTSPLPPLLLPLFPSSSVPCIPFLASKDNQMVCGVNTLESSHSYHSWRRCLLCKQEGKEGEEGSQNNQSTPVLYSCSVKVCCLYSSSLHLIIDVNTDFVVLFFGFLTLSTHFFHLDCCC